MDVSPGRTRPVLPFAYLVAGIAWVVGSDQALATLTQSAPAPWAQTAKGLLFVVLSAALLFVVQARPLARWQSSMAWSRSRWWRAAGVFVVCGASLALGGWALYHQQAEPLRQRAASSLLDSAELTARQIELWLDDRRSALEYAANNPAILSAVRDAVAGDAQATGVLQGGLELMQHGEKFHGVAITTLDGRAVAAIGAPIDVTAQIERQVRGARETGRVVMTDLYVPDGAPQDRPVVDHVVALHDAQGQPFALLLARTDPQRFLFPAISPQSDRATPFYGLARRGRDGATVLATTEGTGGGGEMRFIVIENSAIAAQVVAGRRDVFEGLDYRGRDMFATGLAIERTPWFLVAKMPSEQVYAPLRGFVRKATVLGGTGLVLAALLVALWWRSESAELASRLDAAELRARRLQEQSALAGRLAHDVVMLVDAADARILEVNDRAVEAYGYGREELLRMTALQLRAPRADGDDATRPSRFRELVQRGHGKFTVRHRRKDGSLLPLEVTARTITIGGRSYVQAVGRDITERLEHENRVAAISAERDRLLERMQMQFARMASACIVVTAEHRVLQVNPAFERTFGFRATQLIGRVLDDLPLEPAMRSRMLTRLEALQARPEESYNGVHEMTTGSGATIVCRWSAAALRSADGTVHGVIAMADDITELVSAQQALRLSEERYRVLTEVSPVGVFRADPDGEVVFLNSRAREIAGLGPDEPIAGWVHALHPDDVADVHAAWEGYRRAPDLQPDHQFRVLRADGQVAWVLAQVAQELDGEGRVIGHVGTITDVTAIKQAELELQQAHALLEQRVRERTQQLEAAKNAAEHSDRVKTAFLSTMSHELRTPLNSILGFTDVLLQGLSGSLSAEQARQLRIIRDSSTHLRELVEDVLDISRIEAGQVGLEYGRVELHDLLARKLASFGQEAARKGVRLEMHIDESLGWIRTDARRIGQIIGNLLSNGVKFTDHGAVVLTARRLPDRVEITVADSGVGIPTHALDEIFNPFVQVNRPGGRLRDGTGLGLAISRNLARALGGDVTVTSQLGRGSHFTLWLPASMPVAA